MSLILLVVLAFAAYRITRFVLADSLIEDVREWFFARLGVKDVDYDFLMKHHILPDHVTGWREKLAELFVCPYCLGWWVSGAVVLAADVWTSVPLPGMMWAAVSGAMMVIWRICET